ncbi:MAG: metal ABC transporter permease [Minicystis sp.]
MEGTAAPTLRDFLSAWDLFRDPVLAGMIAGGTLGFLGVYIVLRRMVFVSAALSQAAGLGVAVAFYAQITLGAGTILGDPLATALAFTVATMAFLVRPASERWLSRESVLGAVYLVGSAGTLLVGTRIQQEAHDIQTILFGAAVLVTPADLTKLALVGAAAFALQIGAGRGLRFASFDRDGARLRGLPVRLLDAALLVTIALSVSVATRSLGALPVFAFSVLPAMAAILIAPSVRAATALAAALGIFAGGAGYVAAFLQTWPVGASQAALAAVILLVAAALRALMGRS